MSCKYTLNKPLNKLYPSVWEEEIDLSDTHIAEYPNLQFFKHHVKTITQKKDDNCGISYADALKALLASRATITEGEYQTIKNRVKNNLLKRGLISESVYESYKYAIEGQIVDVAKVIAEDPECFLTPNESYKNYFYELFISVSYPYHVSNETVLENMAKILATVELLEREHIFCKITLVLPNTGCNTGNGKANYLGIIPIFSHKETKTIETMSSVLNDRLLRKFFFAIWEDQYGNDLAHSYGRATNLSNCIVPVNLDECELASSILEQVIERGDR